VGRKLLKYRSGFEPQSFRVSGGVITAYTGHRWSRARHPENRYQDHAELSAIYNQLGQHDLAPPTSSNTPNVGNVYKVWATPVASFRREVRQTWITRGGHGCFSRLRAIPIRRPDNFKAQPGAAATFCLTLQKQLNSSGRVIAPTGPLSSKSPTQRA